MLTDLEVHAMELKQLELKLSKARQNQRERILKYIESEVSEKGKFVLTPDYIPKGDTVNIPFKGVEFHVQAFTLFRMYNVESVNSTYIISKK